MRIRFQADADLNQIIVKATLRLEPSIDFQTAQAAGLAGLDDPGVLKVAAVQGRILVSHDRRTMPTHFGQFIGVGRAKPVDDGLYTARLVGVAQFRPFQFGHTNVTAQSEGQGKGSSFSIWLPLASAETV